MKFFLRLFLILGLLVVVSCGTNTLGRKVSVNTLQGVEYIVLESNSLETSSSMIFGTGKIIFRAPRPEEDSRFLLDFTLEDGGSVTLISNANDQLEKGARIVFERSGTKLNVFLRAGAENYDLSSDFAGVDASLSLPWIAEIHAHGHAVLLWAGTKSEYAFSTRPTDRLWGLALNKAKVTKATATKAEEG